MLIIKSFCDKVISPTSTHIECMILAPSLRSCNSTLPQTERGSSGRAGLGGVVGLGVITISGVLFARLKTSFFLHQHQEAQVLWFR